MGIGSAIGLIIEILISLGLGLYLIVLYFKPNFHNVFKPLPSIGTILEKYRWLYLLGGIASIISFIGSILKFFG